MNKVLDKLNRKRKALTLIANSRSIKKNKTSEYCDNFSLRGYVAKVLKKDKKICCPFGDHYKLEEQKQTSLRVPESRLWKCQNCEGFHESFEVKKLDRREAILDNSLPANNEAALFGNMKEKGIELEIPVAQDIKKFSDAVTREKNVNLAIYLPSCSGAEIILGVSDFSNGDKGFDSSSIKTTVGPFEVEMLDKQKTTSNDFLLAMNYVTKLSSYKEEKGVEYNLVAQGVEVIKEGSDFPNGVKGFVPSSKVKTVDSQKTTSDDALLAVNDDTRLSCYNVEKGPELNNPIAQGNKESKLPLSVTCIESFEVKMFDGEEPILEDSLPANTDTTIFRDKKEKRIELENPIVPDIHQDSDHIMEENFKNLPVDVSPIATASKTSEINMADGKNSTLDDSLPISNDMKIYGNKKDEGAELEIPITLFPSDVHQDSDDIIEKNFKKLAIDASSIVTTSKESEVNMADGENSNLDDCPPKSNDMKICGDNETQPMGVPSSGLNSTEGGTVAAIGTSSEKEHEIDEKMYGEKSISDNYHQVNTLEDRLGLFANEKENQAVFVDPVTKDTVTRVKNSH